MSDRREPSEIDNDPRASLLANAVLEDLVQPENLGMLMDVPVTVSVEIGRTALSLKEILDLGPGSIVSLGKLAGEPMDLLVNGKKIAQGEIVIVDESFGLRDSFGIRVTHLLHTPGN